MIRHKDYDQVFEGLYKEVKKNTNNAVSYIGGDFAQSNYKLSVYTASSASIIAKSASSNHQTANIWCHNDTANWLALGVWGSAGNPAGLITANAAIVG